MLFKYIYRQSMQRQDHHIPIRYWKRKTELEHKKQSNKLTKHRGDLTYKNTAMERKLNMIVFAIFATVALLQSLVASTTYEVGDSLGWTIPSGGSAAYSTWAANKTFIVGDILGKISDHFPFFLLQESIENLNVIYFINFMQPSALEPELMM